MRGRWGQFLEDARLTVRLTRMMVHYGIIGLALICLLAGALRALAGF